ncbi:hypothetical protein MLD38_008417 [Melastoma candidum]|uniref:Uncharacterized protein n=1 Tax=Melastoma candidum TaxID=119954 RepID=A0ACB9RU75_9MYRT|nr:hypothetical protein MLD38_008417 [Melastoma candidum]
MVFTRRQAKRAGKLGEEELEKETQQPEQSVVQVTSGSLSRKETWPCKMSEKCRDPLGNDFPQGRALNCSWADPHFKCLTKDYDTEWFAGWSQISMDEDPLGAQKAAKEDKKNYISYVSGEADSKSSVQGLRAIGGGVPCIKRGKMNQSSTGGDAVAKGSMDEFWSARKGLWKLNELWWSLAQVKYGQQAFFLSFNRALGEDRFNLEDEPKVRKEWSAMLEDERLGRYIQRPKPFDWKQAKLRRRWLSKLAAANKEFLHPNILQVHLNREDSPPSMEFLQPPPNQEDNPDSLCQQPKS